MKIKQKGESIMGNGRADNIVDITWDLKKADIKNKIMNGLNQVGRFISNNKTEVIAVATPIVGKLLMDAVKGIRRSANNKEQARLKENYIWDPSSCMWLETRKKMSSHQRVEFARRRENGESVGSILNSMKILK